MSAENRMATAPWVGPKPYTEQDAALFFGREEETLLLVELLERQRLTILAAASGSGKTSLLQAGLLPASRKRRHRTPQGLGPALLVRDWWACGPLPPAGLLVTALEREIVRLRGVAPSLCAQLARDVDLLAQVPLPVCDWSASPLEERIGAVLGYVSALCSRVGSLLLVVDQAEELLGSVFRGRRTELEAEALEVLGSMFRFVPGVHLLISLREEFTSRLGPLDGLVDSLSRRQFILPPLPSRTVRQIVSQTAATVEGLTITAEAARRLVGLFAQSQWAHGGDGQPDAPVDMLGLQALLLEVFETGCECHGSSRFTIDEELLRRHLGQDDPATVARRALERHIERVLAKEGGEPQSPADDLGSLRRATARMAGVLSGPGGLKQQVEEGNLLLAAVGEDLRQLLGRGFRHLDEAGGLAPILAQFGTAPDQLRQAVAKLGEADPARDRRSGRARSGGWSIEETASVLTRSGLNAIERLVRGSVLKIGYAVAGGAKVRERPVEGPTPGVGLTSNPRSFELMHDGFGPALVEWAEACRNSVDDTLASLVAETGTTFRWELQEDRRGDRRLNAVTWRGCHLEGVTFRDVEFDGCDLRGSVFIDCTFERCLFDGCDLSGAMFQGGRWQDVEWLNRCVGLSVLLRGVEWSGQVRVSSCILDNATLAVVRIPGQALIRDSSLRYAQAGGFVVDGGSLELQGCDLFCAFLADRDSGEVRISDCIHLDRCVAEEPQERRPDR